MSQIFKLSDNSKPYNNITKNFVQGGCYEVDLYGDEEGNLHTKRKKDIDSVNNHIDQYGYANCFIYSQKEKAIYIGTIISKFKVSDNPFYLTPDIMEKAKSNVDISSHPFYKSKVNWNLVPFKEGTSLYTKYKSLRYRVSAIYKINMSENF
jgi:hypothetical protein